ncbi:MAG: DUF4364 family protein [Clostridia bacterium]|nr:DUF4364 family protein [Clostridia bacterium]
MTSDSKLFDSKIIVLYILDISGKSLTINQIVKFCEEFDDITYFDICSYIDSLKKSNYIEENLEDNVMTYSLNSLGKATLKELLELIPGVNLHTIRKMISKNITKIKTDFSINTNVVPIKEDEYKVSCYIKDGNDELVNITLYAGSKEQVKNISKNWSEHAEEIYNQLLNAMTKEE